MFSWKFCNFQNINFLDHLLTASSVIKYFSKQMLLKCLLIDYTVYALDKIFTVC